MDLINNHVDEPVEGSFRYFANNWLSEHAWRETTHEDDVSRHRLLSAVSLALASKPITEITVVDAYLSLLHPLIERGERDQARDLAASVFSFSTKTHPGTCNVMQRHDIRAFSSEPRIGGYNYRDGRTAICGSQIVYDYRKFNSVLQICRETVDHRLSIAALFTVLTCQPPGLVRNMRWRDIKDADPTSDVPGGFKIADWTIPADQTREKTSLIVPLGPFTCALLEHLRNNTHPDSDSDFVFPYSYTASGSVNNAKPMETSALQLYLNKKGFDVSASQLARCGLTRLQFHLLPALWPDHKGGCSELKSSNQLNTYHLVKRLVSGSSRRTKHAVSYQSWESAQQECLAPDFALPSRRAAAHALEKSVFPDIDLSLFSSGSSNPSHPAESLVKFINALRQGIPEKHTDIALPSNPPPSLAYQFPCFVLEENSFGSELAIWDSRTCTVIKGVAYCSPMSKERYIIETKDWVRLTYTNCAPPPYILGLWGQLKFKYWDLLPARVTQLQKIHDSLWRAEEYKAIGNNVEVTRYEENQFSPNFFPKCRIGTIIKRPPEGDDDLALEEFKLSTDLDESYLAEQARWEGVPFETT